MKPLGIVFSSVLMLLAPLARAQTVSPKLSAAGSFSTAASANGVIRGKDGNLYGVTLLSANDDAPPLGTIFKVTPSGQMSVLYKFPVVSEGFSTNAEAPNAIIQGRDGYLYGTTQQGGTNETGTLFRLSVSGQFSVLYHFANHYNGTNFSGYPESALTEGSDGTLYGSDSEGVFKFSPSKQAFTRLKDFPDSYGATTSPLIIGSDGYLYGVRQYGGVYGYGMIFQSDTNGTFLIDGYDFGTVQPDPGDPYDGSAPTGLVESETPGVFYGTTYDGGANDSTNGGDGTLFVFAMAQSPDQGPNVYTLYDFDRANQHGYHPIGALIPAPEDGFYGVTTGGGSNNSGSIFTATSGGAVGFPFSFTPTTGGFSSNAVGAYSEFPWTGLTIGADANIYGATAQGGSHGDGTVYKLTGTQVPQFSFLPANLTANAGNTVTIYANASGFGTLTYEWLFNGKRLANGGNVSGATTGSLTLSNVTTANAGSYVVMVSDVAGSATSTAIPLSVLQISIASPTNNATFLTSQSFDIQATVPRGVNFSFVTFYLDGQPLGTSSVAPYSFSVAAGSVAPGAHIVTVGGQSGDAYAASRPVSIIVNAPGTALIDFDALNATAGAVSGTPLSSYLAGYGVAVSQVTTGSEMQAINANASGGGIEVETASPPNYFTQSGPDAPLSFTLRFAKPLQSLSFTRAGLASSSGMVSHPQWTATAFDTNGTQLGSVAEPLIQTNTLAARMFTLTGAGIASVRFDSDSRQVAAFSAVLLDNLLLSYNPSTTMLSVSLSVLSGTNAVAPAAITLGANVTDTLSRSYSVSFFADGALLGTVSGSPSQLTVTNVLPGAYSLQALVTDSSGASALSTLASLTVQPGANSRIVNFDSLNAAKAPVSGTALTAYLAGFGITAIGLSGGTALSVENQNLIAGGNTVLAASPPNILTQTGSNGPVQFTLHFSTLLSQFGFARPELLANPFVSHPAWQVTAYDGAGAVVSQAAEGGIESYTNVGAREFSLSHPGGPGIATVEFASEGTGLTTFNAMLLDNFVLTTNPLVFPPAVAITQPASGVVLAAPPLVTVTAAVANSEAGNATARFYANGTFLGTLSSGPYTVEWQNPAPGNYSLTVVVMNANGLTTTSPPVNVIIQPPATEFEISSEPASQTVAAGGSATFAVAATGTNLAAYQWYFDGVKISGATASAYVLNPPLQNGNAGTYFATVTEQGVTQRSADALLTVVDAPVITTQPAGQTLPAGSNVVLSVGVSGTGPFSYQWLLNANVIAGATNSFYYIEAAQPRQSGNYQVVVANLAAPTNSAIAPVIVETAITVPETNDTFASRAGIDPLLGPISDSNLVAVAQAGAPLPDGLPGGNSIWFTWRPEFTGTASLTTQGSDFEAVMAVYTGTALNNLKVVAADDGSGGYLTSLATFNVTSNTVYQIAVDGFENASGRVVLGFPAGTAYQILNPSLPDAAPVITKNPVGQAVASGAPATLSVAATSKTKITYQWYFQGEPIPGATGSSLAIKHVEPGAVGAYDVLAANSAGSAQSEPAILQITSGLGPKATSTGSKFFDTTNTPSPAALATALHPYALGGDSGGFSVSQTFSTVGATSEPGQPEPCGEPGDGSEWFVYTAPAGGMAEISTTGSAFNTLMGVYTGSGASFADLVEAGCGYTTNYLTQAQPSVALADVAKGTTFYILVEGYEGASGTARLQIGLGEPLYFSATPPSVLATAGINVTFKAAATGSTPISYQWQLNGANVAGATKSSLTVVNPQTGAEGNYTVIASNILGAVTSSPPAALTLQYAPAIVTGPTNETVTAGQTAKFSVETIGVNVKTNPLVAQWYFNGEPLPKAKSLTLTIPNVNATNAGVYYIVTSNSYGYATSLPATLTVLAKGAVSVKDAVAASPDVSGTYSGLFHPSNGATLASSGYFTATVAGRVPAAFSANLLFDGSSYSFSGEFDSSGNARTLVPRFGKNPVTASLHLGLNPPDGTMTGVVSNGDWLSILQAARAVYNAATNPAPDCAGQFSLVVPASENAPAGTLTVTNTLAGTALVSGTLADGVSLLRIAPMTQGPAIPVYAPLYSGKGLFVGWITLTNSSAGDCGQAFWIKPGSTNATTVSIVK